MKLKELNVKFLNSEECNQDYIIKECTHQDIILDDDGKMIGCLNSMIGDYNRMYNMVKALESGEISSFNVQVEGKSKKSDVYTLYVNKNIKKEITNLLKTNTSTPHLIIHELLLAHCNDYKTILTAPGKIIMRKTSSYRCVETASGYGKTVSLTISQF